MIMKSKPYLINLIMEDTITYQGVASMHSDNKVVSGRVTPTADHKYKVTLSVKVSQSASRRQQE